MSAFNRYLCSIPENEAIQHFIQCLMNGRKPNMAWELMEQVHGEWKCKPEKLPELIAQTIRHLKSETGENK